MCCLFFTAGLALLLVMFNRIVFLQQLCKSELQKLFTILLHPKQSESMK